MFTVAEISTALELIENAERDLGALSTGQRLDLLCDNMEGSIEKLRNLVAELSKRGLI